MSNGNGTAVSIKPLIGKELTCGIYGSGYVRPYNPDNISLNTYIEMLKHPQVNSCLWLIKLPIIGVNWSLKCDSEDIQKDMTERFKAIWIPLIRDMLTAVEFGWSNLEKRWGLDEKKKAIYKPFLPLDPRYSTIRMNGNSFDGIDYNSVPLPPEKVLLFAPEQRFGNLYGRSRLWAAVKPTWASLMIEQFFNRYLEQCGSPQKVVRHPPGTSQTGVDTLGVPTMTANATIAQNIGDSLQNLSTLIMPCNPIMDGKEVEQWAIHLLGQEGGKDYAAGYISALDRLDQQIAKGIFVPDLLTGKSAETGNRAQNESYLDQFMMSEQGLLDLVKGCIDAYVLPQVVEYNYGANAPPVTWDYTPLTDTTKETLKTLIGDMVRGGTLRPDPIWIAEQLGMKLDETPPPEPVKPDVPPEVTPPEKKPEEKPPEPPAPAKAERKGFIASVLDKFKKKSTSFETPGMKFWRPLTPAEVKSGIDFEALRDDLASWEDLLLKKSQKGLRAEVAGYLKKVKGILNSDLPEAEKLTAFKAVPIDVKRYSGILAGQIRDIWNEARDVFAHGYKTKPEKWGKDVEKYIAEQSKLVANIQGAAVLAAVEDAVSAGQAEVEALAEEYLAGPDMTAGCSITVTDNVNLAFQTQAELSEEFKGVELSALFENTCDYCAELDGTQFEINDADAEQYRPPFHYNCRCLWIYIGKDEEGAGFNPEGAPDVPESIGDQRGFKPGEPVVPKWLQERIDAKQASASDVNAYNLLLKSSGGNIAIMRGVK